MYIQLYLSVHRLENKCALQLKCKCKCNSPNACTSSKMCASNQNANANMFPSMYISFKMRVLQPKCKSKCDLQMYISNAHLIQYVIYTKMHTSAKISVHFSQNTNANKLSKCAFQI